MVIVAVAFAPLVLAVLAAVIVTVPPVGGVVGAVYVVFAPLAVWAGENEPQFALPQVTVQLTPAFCLSPVTVALSEVVNPTSREAGGVVIRETPIGGGGKVERQPEITITTSAARTKRRFLRFIVVLLAREWLRACRLRE
jgi:hypothetical protein